MASDLVIRLVRATGLTPYFLAAAAVILAYGGFMAYYVLRRSEPGFDEPRLTRLEETMEGIRESNRKIVLHTSKIVSSVSDGMRRLESLTAGLNPASNTGCETPGEILGKVRGLIDALETEIGGEPETAVVEEGFGSKPEMEQFQREPEAEDMPFLVLREMARKAGRTGEA